MFKMSKRKCEKAVKKTRNVVTLEKKLKIIEMIESGGKITAIGRNLKLPESTVRSIVKQKDNIKMASKSVTPISATKTSRTRSFLMIEMENLLSNWIEDLNRNHMPVTTKIIMNKALSLFDNLKSQHGGEEIFKASKGWFHRFRKRSNMRNFKIIGESASADVKSAEPLTTEELQEMIFNTIPNENNVSEPIPVRKLSVKIIEKALSLHNQCMQLLEENDENYERVCAVKRGCNGLFSVYQQILRSKRKEAKQGKKSQNE